MVHLTIDGRKISVQEGTTIVHAAEAAGIEIPTLCYHKDLLPLGSCRMCMVEVEGYANPMASCTTQVIDGISVRTRSELLERIRKENLQFILVNHPLDCPICDKGGECTLQDLVYRYAIDRAAYGAEKKEKPSDYATPLIRFWPERCIMCLRCVAACRDIKALGAIDVVGSGITASIGPVHRERCESCGECIRLCPTGALTENVSRYKGRIWQVNRVRTTCPYCGCGCQLELNVLHGRIIGVTTADDEGTNGGSLCVRGRFGYEFVGSPERLTTPLVRRDGALREATWDEALGLIAEKLMAAREKHGADAIGGLVSASCTNEGLYLFQKFMRAVIGTNNVDHPARLRHASTTAGIAAAFGSGAMTNPVSQILRSETIFVLGSDVTATHPIFANCIKEAVFRKGARLVVADPRRIDLVDLAQIWLRQRPGTDAALLNGMMHVILGENLFDQACIREKTRGFDEMRSTLAAYTPEYVSEITGIAEADLRAAAQIYGRAKAASIICNADLTPVGDASAAKSLANLAMMCGNVGIEGGGVYPLGGVSNLQGASDMGALPDAFPGYRDVSDPAVREEFVQAWGVDLSVSRGLAFAEMMEAAAGGAIKALYVMGEDPLTSRPDLPHLRTALDNLDFLAVGDIFLTETARRAHVVIPLASFAEEDGTWTNAERLVQRIRRALPPPGTAKPAWETLGDLMRACGYPLQPGTPPDIMEEIHRVVPQYAGITYDRIDRRGIPWPCPSLDHPGTPVLHHPAFALGEGIFQAVDFVAPGEPTDREYPMMLVTGPMLYHDQGEGPAVSSHEPPGPPPESLVEINPTDSVRLGIESGSAVSLTSRHGTVRVKAEITDHTPAGILRLKIHFRERAAGLLIHPTLERWVKIPHYTTYWVKAEASLP